MSDIVSGDDIKASHKIEIHFGPDRTGKKEFRAIVLLMESGKFLNGEGDGQMYLCMDHRPLEKHSTTPISALDFLRSMKRERVRYGCGTPIPSHAIVAGMAICPGCKMMINALHLTGQLPFYGTVDELAEMTEILFHKLGDNADIYCKYHPADIRYKTQEDFKGVETARRLRGLFIYPLKNIFKDLTSGGTLTSRFKALFLA
jgi:hypothetical protein